MEKVFCAGCKFAPANIIWADKCRFIADKTIESDGGYLEMRKANRGNNCPFYKKSFGRFIEDAINRLPTEVTKK